MNPKLDLKNETNSTTTQTRSYDNSSTDNSTNFNGPTKIKGDTNTKISISPLFIVIAALVILGGGFGIFKAVSSGSGVFKTVGGGSSLDNQLVGTWKSSEGEIIFNANHKFTVASDDSDAANWEINGSNNLILSYEGKNIVFVWNENLKDGISFDAESWYISGDVLYFWGERFDRQ